MQYVAEESYVKGATTTQFSSNAVCPIHNEQTTNHTRPPLSSSNQKSPRIPRRVRLRSKINYDHPSRYICGHRADPRTSAILAGLDRGTSASASSPCRTQSANVIHFASRVRTVRYLPQNPVNTFDRSFGKTAKLGAQAKSSDCRLPISLACLSMPPPVYRAQAGLSHMNMSLSRCSAGLFGSRSGAAQHLQRYPRPLS